MSRESIQYDCFRGCAVTHDEATGQTSCSYRAGCCKMGARDWLKDARDGSFPGIYEVRFKNTRKGFYVNDSAQNIRIGDLVVVFRKIYRKARQTDIEKWQEAIAREQDTMIRARKIAAMMGLEMKIGDVEFQGDGSKAIFYYIADGRVDFRQLIKAYAEEFRIRIEMKQIGARQEAGLIGGLGVCGRELCCSNYISSFQSISTSAARCQDLSLNPLKLAGQCGKLKCCLNYEVPVYLDALSRIPKVNGPLEFEDGPAYLRKTDILRETMYFSYEKSSDATLFPLSAEEVREIIEMNRDGEKAESLRPEPVQRTPEFVSAVGDDSISRFDSPRRRKKSQNRRGGGRSRKPGARNGGRPAPKNGEK